MHTPPRFVSVGLLAAAMVAGVLVPSAATVAAGGAGHPFDAAAAQPGEWTWVDVAGMQTRTGTATGIGVRVAADSPDLAIYLAGGGACFNAITCAGNGSSYDENRFTNEFVNGSAGTRGPFGNDGRNPMAGWNAVFVPYTTGDVHAGRNPDADVPGGPQDQRMVGADNLERVLDLAAPYFASAGRVVLTGSSAGGYGAAISYEMVADAFPAVDVTMINDAGSVLLQQANYPDCLDARWSGLWQYDLPDDLDTVVTGDYDHDAQKIYEYFGRAYPDARFGLVTSLDDETIRFFYGFGQGGCADQIAPLAEGAMANDLLGVARVVGEFDNIGVFYRPGTQHTWWGSWLSASAGDMDQFMNSLVDDQPSPHWFTDGAPWYDDAADWVAAEGIMVGFTDASFRPGDGITRAQLVKALHTSQDSPDASGSAQPFDDVPAWVDGAVRWAAEDPDGSGPAEPIIAGYPDDTFRPSEATSRAQAVRMLHRLAGSPDVDLLPQPFDDVPAWVDDAVRWAAEDPDGSGPAEPIIAGYPDDTFRPGNDISRGQWARMLQRFATNRPS